MPIALDDETTWPSDLRKLLDDGLSVLMAFEGERERIDRLAEKDRSFKYHPPSNPYDDDRNGIVAASTELLTEADLIGYHCTRLCEDEIQVIRSTGLRPLSVELADERVQRRLAAGDFSSAIGERLLGQNRVDDRNLPERRTGMTWFIFTTDALRDESGIWRLLTYWGGEALYIHHEEDSAVAPTLRACGTACIVEVAAPVRAIETFADIGEQFIRCFLHRREIGTGHDPGMEGYVQESIPADRIRRVIRRNDTDFERLTACNAWDEPLT